MNLQTWALIVVKHVHEQRVHSPTAGVILLCGGAPARSAGACMPTRQGIYSCVKAAVSAGQCDHITKHQFVVKGFIMHGAPQDD